MNKKRKLPTGLFHHPGSKNLYFKIKKWDEEKEKWVWSSPISSQTTDVALALKTREEAQALSNEIAPNDPASFNQDKAYALVNTILRWHGVPEITKRRAPSWSEAKSGWLDNQKRKLEAAERVPGKDPLAQYRVSLSRLKLFDGYLGSRNPKLSDIHREDAQGFYWDLIEQGYQPSTVLQSVKLLKRIFDQAREDGHIDRNPWAKLETKGNQYRQKEPFSLDDIRKIWANLDKLEHPEEWRTVVLFGLVLGARLKDCTLRTWEEVVLMDPPHIQFHPGKTQKRGIVVKAPLVNPLLGRRRGGIHYPSLIPGIHRNALSGF
jgi:hypothetical protein